MTAVLTPPQALQLGSGKDTLICCTVIIHTTVVLSIARQGSGWFFKGVEEGIKAPALVFELGFLCVCVVFFPHGRLLELILILEG